MSPGHDLGEIHHRNDGPPPAGIITGKERAVVTTPLIGLVILE